MYWAAERRGGKRVHAESAMKGRAYRCPNPRCNAEVFLRSGRWRADHFAHMPGQGKPECEDFHYSDDLARTVSMMSAPREIAHIDPLQLSIELEPQPHKGMPTKWRLRLTVPKSPDAHGQISIDLSDRDPRRISLSKLALGPETYTVALDTLEFGANWVSHDVLPEYREVVQNRIPGLDPRMGNAFEACRSKLKPRTYSLFWGESYYFAWKVGLSISLPATLAAKPLAYMDGWDCAFVALPHDADAEIEAWIDKHCGLTIARPTRDWAVLYPAPYALGDDGDLYVPPSDGVILALKSSGVGPSGALTCSVGRSSIATELDDAERQHLIAVEDISTTGTQNIYLSWDGSYVATLATRAYPLDVPDHAVFVICEGPNGRVQAGLHATPAQTLLANVRLGRLSLIGVSGHPLLRGVLRYRRANATDWHEVPLNFLSHSADPRLGLLGEGLVGQINAAFRDTCLDIELTFGPFGGFHCAGHLKPAAQSQQAMLSVPRALRARIEWLSRACRSYSDRHHRPIASLNDPSLLEHFAQLRVPTNLLAHQRSIDRELRMHQLRGGHE